MRNRHWSAALAAIFITIAVSGSAAQAWTLKTLHNFCGSDNCVDGSEPLAGLVQDASGNLYGTAELGGAHNNGVVFGLLRNGGKWTYKVVHSFCFACGDGDFPGSRLIADVNGNLYGTTVDNGTAPHCGIVFRLSLNAYRKTWKEKQLHAFCATADDGAAPVGGLTYAGMSSGALYDGISPLYGATGEGGLTGRGAIYELVPNGRKWKEHVLYSFCPSDADPCPDGNEPEGDLVLDASGNLYGNTFIGGQANAGLVFKLARGKKGGWSETVLYSFCTAPDCSDGDLPAGGVAIDGAGNLFGTTTNDSAEGGIVYRLRDKSGIWKETILHTFCKHDCGDGYLPEAGLALDSAGNLFGTDVLGGVPEAGGGGVVFRMRGKTFTTLYAFCSLDNCADGRSPQAPVIIGADGHLFGTTVQGGANSAAGTVFELSP